MEHLSNDHENHPNQHENSHKLCNETGQPVVNLMESQGKLKQQHDYNGQIAIVEQMLVPEERSKSQRAEL